MPITKNDRHRAKPGHTALRGIALIAKVDVCSDSNMCATVAVAIALLSALLVSCASHQSKGVGDRPSVVASDCSERTPRGIPNRG
jgi:hypothetical protein